MYWMVTGDKPVDAAACVRNNIMKPASAQASCGLCSADLLHAIDWALKPNEDARPQSAAQFKAQLHAAGRNAGAQVDSAENAQPSTRTLTGSMTTVAVSGNFEPERLRHIEQQAARVLGPHRQRYCAPGGKQSHHGRRAVRWRGTRYRRRTGARGMSTKIRP